MSKMTNEEIIITLKTHITQLEDQIRQKGRRFNTKITHVYNCYYTKAQKCNGQCLSFDHDLQAFKICPYLEYEE